MSAADPRNGAVRRGGARSGVLVRGNVRDSCSGLHAVNHAAALRMLRPLRNYTGGDGDWPQMKCPGELRALTRIAACMGGDAGWKNCGVQADYDGDWRRGVASVVIQADSRSAQRPVHWVDGAVGVWERNVRRLLLPRCAGLCLGSKRVN